MGEDLSYTLQRLLPRGKFVSPPLSFFYSMADELHFLVLTAQIFTTRTRYATSTESNHPNIPRIPNIWRPFQSVFSRLSYFAEYSLAWMLPWKTKILNSSIVNRYPCILFLPSSLSLSLISHMTFIITLSTVTITWPELTTCLWWILT